MRLLDETFQKLQNRGYELDADQLIHRLERQLAGETKPIWRIPTRRRRGWLVAVAAAAAVVLLIGGVAVITALLGDRSQPVIDQPTPTVPPPVEQTPPTVATPTPEDTDTVIESPADSPEIPGIWVEFPGVMYGVVAGGPGFVATGRGEQGPMVWSSTDGVEWVEQYSLDAPGGLIAGVTTTPSGLMAVGALPCQISDCQTVAAAWTSPDGVAWEIAYQMTESSVPPGGDTHMWSVVAYQDTVVATIESCSLDGPCLTEVRTSLDGVTWSPTEWPGSDVSDYWFDIAVGSPGLIAIGQKWDDEQELTGAVWLSEDGTTWNSTQTEGLETVVLALVAARGQGFIAVSSQDQQVFTSLDGIKWSQVAVECLSGFLSGCGAVRDLHTLSDGRTLAVGSTCDGAAAWISQDGSSWNPIFVEGGRFESDGRLRAIAEDQVRLVAVGGGMTYRVPTALIWAAEPDSISTTSESAEPTGGCQ